MPSAKTLKRKEQVVSELANQLKDAQSIVLTDYQGLTVAEDTEMRAQMREAGVKYKVTKNEVIKRALQSLGIELDESVLTGPSALTFSTEDVVLAPRVSKKFVDKFKKTTIKGGIMDGKKVELDTIMQLANIPETEVLYGQLVGSLIYPIRSLAVTLNMIAEKGTSEGKEAVSELVVAKTSEATTETETNETETETQSEEA